MQQSELLDRKQVALRLKLSVRTVERLRKKDQLPKPIVNLPRQYRWSVYQIDAWLQKRQHGTSWDMSVDNH